jgi:hypothetical protein
MDVLPFINVLQLTRHGATERKKSLSSPLTETKDCEILRGTTPNSCLDGMRSDRYGLQKQTNLILLMITARLRLHLLCWFSEQLQGEFRFSPRLYRTIQQLSVRLENRTIPFQRI